MKKILLTVTALGLGLALTASVAAAEMSFTAGGKYNLTGMWISDGGTTATPAVPASVTDAVSPATGYVFTPAVAAKTGSGMKAQVYGDVENNDMWHQSFYLYPKLQVNDNIKMIGELRFLDRDAFAQDGTSANDDLRVYKLWMEYTSPIGTLSTGRMPGGTWGSKFMDTTYAADRIKLSVPVSDTVGLAFIYQKNREADTYLSSSDESDSASYYAGVSLKSDMGKTDAALWHTIDDGAAGIGDYWNTELWLNGAYTIGPVGLTAEVKYAMLGEDSAGNDISSLAFMLDASTKIDTMTAGVLFFYGQGDVTSGDDNEGYITKKGFGNDFNPFLIATNDYTGLLNGDKNNYLSAVPAASVDSNGNGGNPGAIALALYGVMPINDVLTLNAAIGHIWAEENPDGYDDAMGWELDLGMSYKLLDNLTYSAQFGFMKPGDMIEDIAGTDSTNDIIMLVHELTMTF